MHRMLRVIVVTVTLQCAATTVLAQSAGPLEAGKGMVWGSLGFQGDLGGSVNDSGIGVVNGLRAEIDANTWAERYDAALIFQFGGAYNITPKSQLFGAVSMEQSEADNTEVGLIGGQPLSATFSDYQGWGIDVGYRYFFASDSKLKPFVAGSLGFQRLQDITISLSAPGFSAPDVPFYDESWVAGWRLGTGFLWDINDRFGWQVTIDVKYAGELSDQSGIGTLGFERVNNVGSRLTLPMLVGVYAKF